MFQEAGFLGCLDTLNLRWEELATLGWDGRDTCASQSRNYGANIECIRILRTVSMSLQYCNERRTELAVLSLYFNWSIRNCRTIVGHLPFANLTCETALTIALRNVSVVSKLHILPKCSLFARNTLRYPRSRSALAHTSG